MNPIPLIATVIISGVAVLLIWGGGLMNLSYSQLLALATNAGFQGNDAQTAAAIALAESAGNPNEYNPETAASGGTPQGLGSYGLWQIYLKMHPEFSGWNLKDPQTNANAAFSVYQAAGNSFSPWSTYGSGKFLAFLPSAGISSGATS